MSRITSRAFVGVLPVRRPIAFHVCADHSWRRFGIDGRVWCHPATPRSLRNYPCRAAPPRAAARRRSAERPAAAAERRDAACVPHCFRARASSMPRHSGRQRAARRPQGPAGPIEAPPPSPWRNLCSGPVTRVPLRRATAISLPWVNRLLPNDSVGGAVTSRRSIRTS